MNSTTHEGRLGRRERRPNRPRASGRAEGFTKLDLLAMLAAVGLLAVLTLPALASNRERSLRVLCVNNLRLAGQAFQQFSTEQGGRVPWRTPWCEGGTMPTLAGNCSGSGTSPSWLSSGINNNAWFQWYWMSNELRSPKVLACPSDAQKRPARDWSFAADGGFLHANYRNGALSYLLGLDVLPENRLGLLAGDRNVRFNLFGQSCSSGIAPVFGLNLNLVPGSFGIGNGLHVESGNYLFTDGRVEELSSQGFVKRLQAVYGVQDNGAVHFLTP